MNDPLEQERVMSELQRAYEDMDDMIDAIEKGGLLMLDEKEGLRLLVVKQRALGQALADNAALEQRVEHFERFKLFLEIMGGIDVEFAWEESATEEEG